MSDSVSTRYSSLREDMAKHDDPMTSLVYRIRSMKTNLDDSLAIGILVSSIAFSHRFPATTAIKSLAEEDIS